MKIIKYIILALTILLLFTGIVSATIMNTSFPSVYISFNTTSDLTKTIDNNEYTLTNYGVAINTDNYKFGGGSGYFNGSSHEYSNGNPITSAPYSITGWINTSVTTESILDFGTSSTAAGLAFHLLNGVWIVDDGHASGSGPQGGHVALNEWNYYAIIANGTTTALYVNGTLINTHAGTTMYGTPTRFSLGAHGYGSTWGLIYSGYMDDIVFYNHAINGTVVPDRELISNPMASFSQNVTHGNAPLSISFTNTSLGNIADTNYNWSYTNSSATGGNGTQIFWSNVASPTAILTTGNWSINETITNPFGDSTALSWVNVSPGSPPIANFTYSPTSGPSPLTVDFTDTSASSITAWNWTFGAANYSSLQNPSYTFVGAGNYSVTLQVTNASGTNTTINYVDVLAVTDPNPTSMIKYKSGESSIAISNQSQPYVGTVTARNITSNTTYIAGNFTWIPGNVAVSNIRINQSAVNISGASLISSSINNANGHALFNISNPSGFTSPANALIDFNITYTKYLAPGSRVNFSYSLPYCRYYDPVNVTWWTFNQYQGADAIIGTWGPVTANFTANVTAVAEYAPIQFTDTSTGYPDAWGWDFGDGSTSSAQNPVYSYATTGLKTVSLHSYMAENGTITDTITKTDYINVTAAPPPAPVADFTGTPTAVSLGTAVQFNDTSAYSPTSWSWNFGDSLGSSLQNPSHVYTSTGVYNVSLTATNAQGSDTKTRINYINVTALAAPVSSFVPVGVINVSAPITIQFNDTSSNNPTSWLWSYKQYLPGGIESDWQTFSIIQNSSLLISGSEDDLIRLQTTNAAGTNLSTQITWINATVASGFNRQDLYLSPEYTLVLTIKDTDGNVIPVVTVSDSDGNVANTTNGVYTHTYPYEAVAIYLSSSGYQSRSVTYVMNRDRVETVQMMAVSTNTQNNNVIYYPTQVEFILYAASGNPLSNAFIEATPLNFTAPANWTSILLGINSQVNITGTTVSGYTGTDGTWAAPMLASNQYSVTISGTYKSSPYSYTITLYPAVSPVQLTIPIGVKAVPTSAAGIITYSLSNTSINSTAQYVTMRYTDTSLSTSTLVFWVVNATGETVTSTTYTGSAANSQTFNQTFPVTMGQSYTYGFSADTSNFEDPWINQSQSININYQIGLLGQSPGKVELWLAIAILVMWAAIGSIYFKNIVLIGFPLLWWFMAYYLGWMPINNYVNITLGVMLVVGIAIYIRYKENQIV